MFFLLQVAVDMLDTLLLGGVRSEFASALSSGLGSRSVAAWLLLRNVFDAEKVARPEFFELADPAFVDLPDGHDVQRIHPLPALFAGLDEVGFTKHVDVFHDAEAR